MYITTATKVCDSGFILDLSFVAEEKTSERVVVSTFREYSNVDRCACFQQVMPPKPADTSCFAVLSCVPYIHDY